MIKFNKKYPYPDKMDEEVRGLCDAMNALHGIETTGSCCGHSSSPLRIWFNSISPKGLFFLSIKTMPPVASIIISTVSSGYL